MSSWSSLRIVECIEKIEREELVLPVVQRDFVGKSDNFESFLEARAKLLVTKLTKEL